MQLIREIGFLLQKEFTLEWRQKYAISGILLYVLSTVYIVYSSFTKLEPAIWNIQFWVIILFASVSAVVKSFQQESGQRQLYYYSLANPLAVLLSKMLYNTLLLLFLSILAYLALSLVAGNQVQQARPFALALLLGSLGFSITFTFVSAIASKASNSATLMAILSFPLIIPVLMTLIKMTAAAVTTANPAAIDLREDLLTLVAIDLLLLGAALALFPFLWRD
ncbi:MAG: heme exporter protein CcmB [Saprospiraceae bacterium]|nr:heme exporter protein CcmB [Saprospiraceae bacterium]MCB0627193.1 heme exporter protein CcmB [Saprospiraceae bacterium]MCB0676918.1 heme exporter protein CcmB [Saprospiraceae bacterium]MCB0680988.1 heme exporter protein CcmB [Saprospiraceae bacterium]